MFSYLKPHRRSPSNPTSPILDSAHSWDGPLQHHHGDHALLHAVKSQDSSIPHQAPPSPTSASTPPSLRPIARVSSPGFEGGANGEYKTDATETKLGIHPLSQRLDISNTEPFEVIPTQWPLPHNPQRSDTSNNSESSRYTSVQAQRLPTGVAEEQFSAQKASATLLPNIASIDSQGKQTITGRRATGVRMPTPPPAPAPVPASTFEPIQSRSGKHTRLNLLNPMSLLARRRTSQAASELSISTASIIHQPTLYEPGFDPRIRGTKVHDFSAPKPRRIVSDNYVPNVETRSLDSTKYHRSPSWQHVGQDGRIPEEPGDRSPWNGANRTPIFTEDFEEQQYPAAEPHVRKASDISDLPLPRPPYATDSLSAKERSISRAMEDYTLEDSKQLQRKPAAKKSAPLADKGTIPIEERHLLKSEVDDSKHISIVSPHIPSRQRASKAKRVSRKVSENFSKDLTTYSLPKHMKSNSSRFSFDMSGAASQERILEERHRQKAIEKQAGSPRTETQQADGDYDDEDEFDFDDMDDDDGLEERIPGINADADDSDVDDDFEDDSIPKSSGLGAFTFHSMNISVATSPSTPYTPAVVTTPRDAQGEVIGFAVSQEPSENTRGKEELLPDSTISDEQGSPGDNRSGNTKQDDGLGLVGVELEQGNDTSLHNFGEFQQHSTKWNKGRDFEDDDLYFDDGIIGHPDDDGDGVEFDESVFDNDDTDEYGRPLRPLSSLPTVYSPPLVQPDLKSTSKKTIDSKQNSLKSQDRSSRDELSSPICAQSTSPGSMKDSPKSHQAPLRTATSLTHDTLVAYQTALAAAANEAAATGRFRRESSADIQNRTQPANEDETIPHQSSNNGIEDDFDYNDALEDDAIIAEANAEALANDADGFYGQEFGYYSAPLGAEAEYVNGGYFGPRGADGLGRSHSGRAATREPNLTPITERSEYSNRNSALSLQFPHNMQGSGPLDSANLAQLAGTMSEYDEDNMSLSALMKLRRGAWGGSQASLRSSNNGGGGSPLSAYLTGDDASPTNQLSPWVTQSNSQFSHMRHNSNFSIGSESLGGGKDSEANSAPSSPTVTLSTLHLQNPKSQTLSASPRPQLPVTVPMATADVPSQPMIAPPPPPTTLMTSLQSRTSPTMSPISDMTAAMASNLNSAVGLVSPTNETFDRDNGFCNSQPNGRSQKSSLDAGGSSAARRAMHRHTGSSDSISYMKEEDPVTGQRWVLERRRTGEDGGVEILGREVVSGGRI